MKKLIILFLLLLLLACDIFKAPGGPDQLFTIQGYLFDDEFGQKIANTTIHVNEWNTTVDSTGYFRLTFRASANSEFMLSCFPYEPLFLPIDKYSYSFEDTIKLAYPPKLKEFSGILKKAQKNGYKV